MPYNVSAGKRDSNLKKVKQENKSSDPVLDINLKIDNKEEKNVESYNFENSNNESVVSENNVISEAYSKEIIMEEYKINLIRMGLNNNDIDRVINGEISLELLIQEIENDPDKTRKKEIMKSSYLESIFSSQDDMPDIRTMDDLLSEIESLQIELREKRSLTNSKYDVSEKIEGELIKLEEQLEKYKYIYDYINSEVDYYIENVDKYIGNDDFLKKNNFLDEQKAASLALTLKNKQGVGHTHYDSGLSLSSDEVTKILYYMINGLFTTNNGTSLTMDDITVFIETNSTIRNFSDWIPYITEQEKQIINYVYNTEGGEGLQKYLENISDQLDSRWLAGQTQIDQEYAKENNFLASLGSVLKTPIEGLNAFCYSMNAKSNDEKIRRSDVYSSGNVWRSQVAQDIANNSGEGWAFLYSTGMSIVDSVELVGLTALSGGAATPILSTTLMGTRAYVSTLNDALNKGLSDGQAISLAFSAAVVESAMESYSTGHLFHLEEELGENVLKNSAKIASKIKNEKVASILTKAFYVLASAGSQGLVEGEEELSTDLVNYITDIIISKDLSDYEQSVGKYLENGYRESEAILLTIKNFGSQLIQTFAGGFISGICFGSFSGGKTTINTCDRIANQMYGKLNGLTSAQQFVEALEIERLRVEALKNLEDGIELTPEQKRLLFNMNSSEIENNDASEDVTAPLLQIGQLLEALRDNNISAAIANLNLTDKIGEFTVEQYLMEIVQLRHAILRNDYNLDLSVMERDRLDFLYEKALEKIDASKLEYSAYLPDDIRIKTIFNDNIFNPDDIYLLMEYFYDNFSEEILQKNPFLVFSKEFSYYVDNLLTRDFDSKDSMYDFLSIVENLRTQAYDSIIDMFSRMNSDELWIYPSNNIDTFDNMSPKSLAKFLNLVYPHIGVNDVNLLTDSGDFANFISSLDSNYIIEFLSSLTPNSFAIFKDTESFECIVSSILKNNKFSEVNKILSLFDRYKLYDNSLGKAGSDQHSIADAMESNNRSLISSLIKQVQEQYPGISIKDAKRFLKSMDVEAGICNYSNIANFIFEYFLDHSELSFSDTFGFPMYIDGKLNDSQLLTDMMLKISGDLLIETITDANGVKTYKVQETNENYYNLTNPGTSNFRHRESDINEYLSNYGLTFSAIDQIINAGFEADKFDDATTILKNFKELLGKATVDNPCVVFFPSGFTLSNDSSSLTLPWDERLRVIDVGKDSFTVEYNGDKYNVKADKYAIDCAIDNIDFHFKESKFSDYSILCFNNGLKLHDLNGNEITLNESGELFVLGSGVSSRSLLVQYNRKQYYLDISDAFSNGIRGKNNVILSGKSGLKLHDLNGNEFIMEEDDDLYLLDSGGRSGNLLVQYNGKQYRLSINDIISNGVTRKYSYNLHNSEMFGNEIIKTIAKNLLEGKHLSISMGKGGMLKRVFNGREVTLEGGHIMTIYGISDDGKLLVDSWGKKYMIDVLANIKNGVRLSVDGGIISNSSGVK